MDGVWGIGLLGNSTPLPVGISFGDFTLRSPRSIGATPGALTGGVLLAGFGVSLPFGGLGAGTYSMGFGRGNVEIGGDTGVDIGVGIFTGISLPFYANRRSCVNAPQ